MTVQGKKITVKGEGPIRVEEEARREERGAVNVEASGNVKIRGATWG